MTTEESPRIVTIDITIDVRIDIVIDIVSGHRSTEGFGEFGLDGGIEIVAHGTVSERIGGFPTTHGVPPMSDASSNPTRRISLRNSIPNRRCTSCRT